MANGAGWHDAVPTATFSCADPSGVPACPEPHSFDEDEAGQAVTVIANDVWGNTGTLVVGGINVDTTEPVLGFTGALESFALTDVVQISCAATDELSGVATLSCPAIDQLAVDLGAGLHTLTAVAVDHAGNTASATVTFTVHVTVAGVGDLVDLIIGEDRPGNQGLANSLRSMIERGNYEAFIREVEAQCCTDLGNGQGKRLTRREADTLIALVRLLD
jgi:hypothetical protein